MRDHFTTLLCALFFLLLSSCGGGGGDLAGGGGGGGGGGGSRKSGETSDLGGVELVNTTDVSGRAVAEVVMPLKAGDFAGVPFVVTKDDKVPCQAFAMGAKYDDGSLRYLRLEVPVDVQPRERRTIALLATDQTPPPFEKHGAIRNTIGVDTRLRVGQKTFAFPEPALIEEGPVTKVYRSRLRATGSMLWAELTISLYTKLNYSKFTLQWGNSDPSNPELYEDPGQVELQIQGPDWVFEQPWKILKSGVTGTWRFALLHDGGQISDGQSQVLEGRFLYEGGVKPRVFAIAKNWGAVGTFGPYGYLMPEIAVNPDDFANLIKEESRKQRNHPWARCVHGCNPDPSNTGYQNDFGTTMMRADVLLADPRRIPTILRSIYQEACRATHHRETDVSRVTAANHPNLLTLDGRPKTTESKDLLGKKRAWLRTTMKGPSNERWLGHDVEHLSINYLAGIALLTGNRWARDEVDHHVELYLTGFTHKTGGYNDSPGPARKVGRSSLAAIWMWQVTGRDDVRKRLINRTDDVLAKLNSIQLNIKVVAPRGSYWVPWEEGMAATGLYAVYRNFGTTSALDVINLTTASLGINGFAKLSNGQWRCGYELPWRFSNGKDYVASQDPNFGNLAAGNGLTTWSIPGLFIAAEHHPNPAVRAHCLKILRERYSRKMNGLSFDLQWVCVSANAAKLANMTSNN
jgi:hypothetical protein